MVSTAMYNAMSYKANVDFFIFLDLAKVQWPRFFKHLAILVITMKTGAYLQEMACMGLSAEMYLGCHRMGCHVC